jgi:hypothetical protein
MRVYVACLPSPACGRGGEGGSHHAGVACFPLPLSLTLSPKGARGLFVTAQELRV